MAITQPPQVTIGALKGFTIYYNARSSATYAYSQGDQHAFSWQHAGSSGIIFFNRQQLEKLKNNQTVLVDYGKGPTFFRARPQKDWRPGGMDIDGFPGVEVPLDIRGEARSATIFTCHNCMRMLVVPVVGAHMAITYQVAERNGWKSYKRAMPPRWTEQTFWYCQHCELPE